MHRQEGQGIVRRVRASLGRSGCRQEGQGVVKKARVLSGGSGHGH